MTDTTDTIMPRQCACGAALPEKHASWTCHCGRQYERPRVNLERLLSRVDDLEHRLAAIEHKVRAPA